MDEKIETKEVTHIETSTPESVVKTTTKVTPPIRMEHPQRVYDKKKTIFRMYQIIWYILAVIEVLLAFRVALKALGANPLSTFVNLIYTLSNPFALPFSGILGTNVSGGSVFEWSTIIAAIVYLLIAYGLVHLLQLVKPVTPREVSEAVDDPPRV
jgi:hypothetical protein